MRVDGEVVGFEEEGVNGAVTQVRSGHSNDQGDKNRILSPHRGLKYLLSGFEICIDDNNSARDATHCAVSPQPRRFQSSSHLTNK